MRKLVATLACRNQGSRLYGKPLQNLDIASGSTILDHMVLCLKQTPEIGGIVLGISEGIHNMPFIDVARSHEIDFIIGDQKDVLLRLIQCCKRGGGTDAFRVTTESPYFAWELIERAWQTHLDEDNDVTVCDGLPEGCHFEIYKLSALEASHERGEPKHRSELCSLYIRENQSDFKVRVIDMPAHWERMDHRLTVDYPEDLVVCRAVYEALKDSAPKFKMDSILEVLDSRDDLKQLLAPFTDPMRLWA